MKKRILSIVLTLCMVLMFMPQTVFAEDGVPYLDETGAVQTCPNATAVTESDTEWTEGWYVVTGDVTISGDVALTGDVHLILADGCTLTVNGSIVGGSLTIYGQDSGTGMLAVTGDIIGGTGDDGGSGGGITINGGSVNSVNITGGNGGSGGYGDSEGGYGGKGGSITINGGSVNSDSITGGTGGNGGNGIDAGGSGGTGGSIIINGGSVNSDSITGGNGGTGGDGYSFFTGNGGEGGSITIKGGIVNADNITGGTGGDGGDRSVNGGNGGTGGSIAINGGSVDADKITGGKGGNGSRNGSLGGSGGTGGNIDINAGSVDADKITGGTGGDGGDGNTGGSSGTGGSITINGGSVNADSITGGNGGNGGGNESGGRNGGTGGSIAIKGGSVNADSITGGNGGNGGNAMGPGNGGTGGSIDINGGIVNSDSITGGNGGNGGVSHAGGIDDGSDGSEGSVNINEGIVFQGNSGRVYGTSVTLSESFTIPAGKTLTIDSSQTLIIPDGVTLTIPEGVTLTIAEGGTLTNNSFIYVDGTLTQNGTLSGTGGVYYPLTVTNGTADGDVSTYQSKNYGKAGGEITLTPDAQIGYSFDKWEVSPASVTIGADNKFTMPSAALTATAQWKINQYTITFDTDGGSEIDPVTQDYDTEITAPENPTKTGYIFAGWDQSIPDKMPAEDMKITAKWTVCDHSGSTAQPTCKHSAICTVCGGTIPTLSHSLEEIAAKSATCTENGNIKYYKCSDCGDLFADENAETAITIEDTVDPATGHSYKDGKCVNCGSDDPATIGGPDEYECNCIFCSIGRWIKAFVKSCITWLQNTPVSIGKWFVGVFNNIIALVK